MTPGISCGNTYCKGEWRKSCCHTALPLPGKGGAFCKVILVSWLCLEAVENTEKRQVAHVLEYLYRIKIGLGFMVT